MRYADALIPNGMVIITPLVLDDAAVHTLSLTEITAEGVEGLTRALAAGEEPLILRVIADGAFYVGGGAEADPSAAVNGAYEADVWHSIPVNGQTAMKFLRSGSATVTLKGELLIGR